MCCLRLSATLSYEKTQTEIAIQTGRAVSLKTQQRLVHRQNFDTPVIHKDVTQMSLDGGMIRLRTVKGQPCEWREYKALNLPDVQQGMAWFKDNESLQAWANALPVSELIDCLGDGHDGIWRVYEHIAHPWQRHEILDWFHLMENLHQLPLSDERLQQLREFLWHGKLEHTLSVLHTLECPEALRFQGYLERHRDRIPNYAYYQAEGIPIGSGDVESLVKQINARTKIAGADWEALHIPQVLAHRCAYLNGMLSPEFYFLSRK